MYIYHADKNSLPQQVQENLENIQKLAGVVREIYTTSQELDSSSVAIGLSATTIDVDNFTTGYLVDHDGDVFNIENIENDIVYISYIMTVRGAQGAQGEKGDTGEAATISVGSVTTLDAGSDATVTNVGTTSAAVFNFGIPQGADGGTSLKIYKHNCIISIVLDGITTVYYKFFIELINTSDDNLFAATSYDNRGSFQDLWDVLFKYYGVDLPDDGSTYGSIPVRAITAPDIKSSAGYSQARYIYIDYYNDGGTYYFYMARAVLTNEPTITMTSPSAYSVTTTIYKYYCDVEKIIEI